VYFQNASFAILYISLVFMFMYCRQKSNAANLITHTEECTVIKHFTSYFIKHELHKHFFKGTDFNEILI